MPRSRAALAAIFTLALVHATLFISYQRPDWTTAWTDQGGYRLLGHGLAVSGTFTRYPDASAFVPEAIRTPGYPMFVATVYRLFGESQEAVVRVQTLAFALLCLIVYWASRHIASPSTSLAAAALTALYPTFPYFGALVLTELWTTFVLTCGMACLFQALRSEKLPWFALAGLLIGVTALTRPGFFLLPSFLAVPAALHIWQSRHRPASLARWAMLVAIFAVVMAPWFAYNQRHFGQLTLSPAGSLGRPIWEASWQGVWAGRTQAQLTRIADQADSDTTLQAAVDRFAADQALPATPMHAYTRQWRTIRAIWTTPTDPEERVQARIAGDQEYLRVGLENIAADPLGYVRRRLTRGLFVLWAADVPVRFTDINNTPTWLIRGFWGVQALLLLIGAYGALVVWRTHGLVWALMLVTPLVYVTAVHLPILCEARQSLPVKPLLLMLVAVGGHDLLRRTTSPQTSGS